MTPFFIFSKSRNIKFWAWWCCAVEMGNNWYRQVRG